MYQDLRNGRRKVPLPVTGYWRLATAARSAAYEIFFIFSRSLSAIMAMNSLLVGLPRET